MFRSEPTTTSPTTFQQSLVPAASPPDRSKRERFDVIVIGAGAAGLLSAARAAELGKCVLLLEKNRKAGVKILMSGGTRCNITQAVDSRGIIDEFGDQGRFLHSALAALPPEALIELIEAEGVATKIEETGKIFPASNKAADVLGAFLKRLRRSGAELALEEAVVEIAAIETDDETDEGAARISVHTDRRSVEAAAVIVTTGGQSYPGCGTTGDGYHWLKKLGHTIVPPRPALTPIKTRADWAKALRGVTIPDVAVSVVEENTEANGPSKDGSGKNAKPARSVSRKRKGGKRGPLEQRRGGMLFAHFGLSGPAILDVSRAVALHPRPRSLTLLCDFLPEVPKDEFIERLQQLATAEGKRQIAGLLTDELPRRLVESLLEQAGVDGERRAAELSKADRAAVTTAFKEMRIPITGTLGFEKAEVTTGGVSLKEVNSKTMESKLVPGLFLAGEILDLDGPIGGFNFQAAFSTGYLAGESAAWG